MKSDAPEPTKSAQQLESIPVMEVVETGSASAEYRDGASPDARPETALPNASSESVFSGLSNLPVAIEIVSVGQGVSPRWLHPTSIVFDVISHIRSYIVPFVLALFGFAQDEAFWQYMALIIFGMSLIRTVFHYITLRYQISGQDLVINSGLVFRRVRTIPIRKIQNVDLIQNLLHRLFGVAEVRIETASGAEADAVLRVLSLRDVDQLRQSLFPSKLTSVRLGHVEPDSIPLASESDRDSLASPPVQDVNTVEFVDAPPIELVRIPFRNLLWAGLSSDRGFLLAGIAVGALYQFNGNWMPNRAFWRIVGQYSNSWLTIAAALAGVWFLLKLFGVIWCILRFHGYHLFRVGDDLRISSGLLTRVSATIPRQRIQFISVHRPVLFRWRGLATVKIETAGGAGKEGEHSTALSRSWFVPVIPFTELPRLLSELRPGLSWVESAQSWQAVSPRASRRLIRLAIFTALLISIAGGIAWRYWGATAGFVFLPLLVLWARRKSRAMSYARTEFGVAYRSGLLTKKMSLTFFERIQAVKVQQSPFDRRWKMASLTVDTAAAGPADHVISIPYLDADFAKNEFLELRSLVASHNLVWS